MSLLHKLGISHIVENQPTKDPRVTKKVSRGKKILFYGIIVGVAVLLFGLWAISLMSPTFDMTPTELGTGDTEKPLEDALQQIGDIFEQ